MLHLYLFSGDTDAVIPVTSTRYNVDSLKLPTVTPWHAWYDDDGQVSNLFLVQFYICYISHCCNLYRNLPSLFFTHIQNVNLNYFGSWPSIKGVELST